MASCACVCLPIGMQACPNMRENGVELTSIGLSVKIWKKAILGSVWGVKRKVQKSTDNCIESKVHQCRFQGLAFEIKSVFKFQPFRFHIQPNSSLVVTLSCPILYRRVIA